MRARNASNWRASLVEQNLNFARGGPGQTVSTTGRRSSGLLGTIDGALCSSPSQQSHSPKSMGGLNSAGKARMVRQCSDLFDLVVRSDFWSAKNPRDRTYGCIDLATDFSETKSRPALELFRADYSKSLEHTYTDLALRCIKHYEDLLGPWGTCAMIGWNERFEPSVNHLLPSRVYDWSQGL